MRNRNVPQSALRLILLVCSLVAARIEALAAPGELPVIQRIDKSSITVSGLSSGAAMAVQIGTVHSRIVRGVGILAGPPYLCAEGSVTRAYNTCLLLGRGRFESWFGLAGLSLTWFLDGFNRHPDGTWWARGWYSLAVGLTRAEAEVIGVERGGAAYALKDLRSSGSKLQIEVSSAGSTQTFQDAGLDGVTLVLRVPDVTGLVLSTYRLRLGSQQSLDSQLGDVYGYGVEYRAAGLLGSSWSSYCRGPAGEAQRAVFYQGARWNPLDGTRSDGADRITLTCETGSVA